MRALPYIVNGLTLGLLFALIALGFMLIVGVMEVINLAHGTLFALGAYFALAIIDRRRLVRRADSAHGGSSMPLGDALHPGADRGAGAGRRCRAWCSSSACGRPMASRRSTAFC